MDAVKFLKEFGRLCAYYSTNTDCKECPLLKYDCCRNTKNEDIACAGIVEQWAKEHPAKTRQSEFLKMWPNARSANGSLAVCPMDIMGREYVYKNIPGCINSGITCDQCRRDFWLKEIE